jgi:hypothetical protein
MSKTAAPSTQAAMVLAPDAPVLIEDLVTVVEQIHETVTKWCPTLMAWNGAPAAVMSAKSPSCLNLQFNDTIDTWVTKVRGHIRVAADYQELRVGAECVFASGETGEIKFFIGVDEITLAFNDADNDTTVSDVIAAPAPGLIPVTIALKRTAGASLTNANLDGWIQVETIAATDLPDPADS